MVIENVTGLMNGELAKHDDIQAALGIISGCALFSRETRSAALGEISEHLIARMLNGQRRPNGSKGCDVVDAQGAMIEVKSRLTGRWGDTLMFDFSTHTASANRVFCVAWDDKSETSSIYEAYAMPVSALVSRWGGVQLRSHCARTTLKKLRLAWQAERSIGIADDGIIKIVTGKDLV
jgi:hypothetical protein